MASTAVTLKTRLGQLARPRLLRRLGSEHRTLQLSNQPREMGCINASYMVRAILPLVMAFAVGMTVCWQLKAPSAGGSCGAGRRGRSSLTSFGAWRDQSDPAFSTRTPSDAVLAVCLAVKDQHEDLREVCVSRPSVLCHAVHARLHFPEYPQVTQLWGSE